MVARISIGRSIGKAISYNERKVGKGDAALLFAAGFPCDGEILGFTQKLKRFQILNELKPKVKTNTLHISLNFPPEEILTDDRMKEIAQEYMERIGFGEQPYLVYRHEDAKHPHIHIVTNTIKDNGRPIPLHNLAKVKSEYARKSIEEDFGLIAAASRKKQPFRQPTATDLLPIAYGQEEVKEAITKTLSRVIPVYKFTSLEELNVILRPLNIIADRGHINSRMYQQGGLVYSLIDDQGNRIGRSIKASTIYGPPAPIIKTLEKKFAANMVKKLATKPQVQNTIRDILSGTPTADQFAEKLRRRGIRLHFDHDRLGAIKSLYFIDQVRKATYTHSELGLDINQLQQLKGTNTQLNDPLKKGLPTASPSKKEKTDNAPIFEFGTHSTFLLMQSLFAGSQNSGGPGEPIPRKKKKKKRPPL